MKKNIIKDAFLSIPIQGIRFDENIYTSIIDTLKKYDINVINKKEISNPPSDSEVIKLSPYKVHEHDINLLKLSQVFITEITTPSLGVGYEIAIAESIGLPIIYIYNSSIKHKVSLMILGSNYKNRSSIEYTDVKELKLSLSGIINDLKADNNKFNSNNIINHFKIKSKNYDTDVNWRQDEKMLSWFRNSLQSCNNCLDIGTGSGIVGAELKKNNSLVYGIDISTEMLKIGQKRLDLVIKGDVSSLPFLGNQFDGISLRQVLHYVDDKKSIKEAFRVLKTNGLLACAHVASPTKELYEWWNGLKSIVQPLRKRNYTQNELINLYVNSGFEVVNKKMYSLKRIDKWETFIINSNVNNARNEVENYLENTSEKIKKEIQLQVDSDTISYCQYWSLIICKKK